MKKTVLIVEDNELNMKLFNDLLEAHGYATLMTGMLLSSSSSLSHLVTSRPDTSGSWMSIRMRSGRCMKGDEERIREGGCEAYLSKPISVAKFLSTVRT
jgi:two-component system cell cycle response regulator DivK